jgi:hypothetical protein
MTRVFGSVGIPSLSCLWSAARSSGYGHITCFKQEHSLQLANARTERAFVIRNTRLADDGEGVRFAAFPNSCFFAINRPVNGLPLRRSGLITLAGASSCELYACSDGAGFETVWLLVGGLSLARARSRSLQRVSVPDSIHQAGRSRNAGAWSLAELRLGASGRRPALAGCRWRRSSQSSGDRAAVRCSRTDCSTVELPPAEKCWPEALFCDW